MKKNIKNKLSPDLQIIRIYRVRIDFRCALSAYQIFIVLEDK